MFRRYDLEYVEDTVVLEFRGDVRSRTYLWMGALDALLLAGHQRFVINLDGIRLGRDADADFFGRVAEHINDSGGIAVFVPPSDAHGQRLLRRSAAGTHVRLVETAEAGVQHVTSSGNAAIQRYSTDQGSRFARATRAVRRRLASRRHPS